MSAPKPQRPFDLQKTQKTPAKKYNEISLKVNVSESELNSDIYFICDKKNNTYYSYDHFNEKNCDIFVDGKKVGFCKSYKFDRIGYHSVLLKLREKIKIIRDLFFHCKNIVFVDMSRFDCENLTSMAYSFSRCTNLRHINFNNFNTSKVTTMCSMFYGCNNLQEIDLSSFNTKNVIDMSQIFYGCEKIKHINLGNLIMNNVLNISFLFRECSSLCAVDFKNLNFKNVKTLYGLFYQCSSISCIIFLGELDKGAYGDELFVGLGSKGILISNKKNKHKFLKGKNVGKRWKVIKE